MPRAMAGLAILLTFADHWTTWMCLRAPIRGWQAVEANPAASFLFETLGLLPGLLLDSLLTLAFVAFVLTCTRLDRPGKASLLGTLAAATAFAVVNNALAMSSLGLEPLAWG